MSIEQKVHNVIREIGLAPPNEDLPLIACSTPYRENLFRALDREGVDSGEDRIHELEHELEYEQEERRADRAKIEDLETDLSDTEDENQKLGREVHDLKAKLEKLQGAAP